MSITADTSLRYHGVARALHWIMAILIIGNIVGGIFHDALGKMFPVMPMHKAAGITILALALARLGWRLTHPAPALPVEMPGWEKLVAKVTHIAFYALMILVPLSGWIMVSPGDRPLNWFGLFPVPKFGLAKTDAIVGLSREGHEILGLAFAALVILHIVAALRHHFILRDTVLRRML